MPGQPDWQRYQSSMGPLLYTYNGSGVANSGILPVGPWRSWFMYAKDTHGAGVWTVSVSWYADAAGTFFITTNSFVVGNSVSRIGWLPMIAPYMRIQAFVSTPAGGDNLQLYTFPSLMESLVGGRYTASTYIRDYEASIAHGFTYSLSATYSMPGSALLTVRSNGYQVLYDMQRLGADGGWTSFYRFQNPEINAAEQYLVSLPDQPVRVQVENAEPYAVVTYDLTLAPT